MNIAELIDFTLNELDEVSASIEDGAPRYAYMHLNRAIYMLENLRAALKDVRDIHSQPKS